jgi:transcriptional regulator with XRE-family HTH domain
METLLINTIPSTQYLYTSGGSGSSSVPNPSVEVGNATAAADPNQLRYDLAGLLPGRITGTVATVIWRASPSDLVGAWLEGASDCAVEATNVPSGAYARALDEIRSDLGITLTYVAHCLGMQRSAVYRWYEGALPHPANRTRLKTLQEFARVWKAANLPSLRTYWESEVPATGKTLGQLLSASALDIAALRAAVEALVAGAKLIQPKSARLGFRDRARNRQKERERLRELAPEASHEGIDHEDQ